MTTLLVWVLVVSSWNSTRNMVEMLGNFPDLETCQRVQQTKPLERFLSQCIQVKVVK